MPALTIVVCGSITAAVVTSATLATSASDVAAHPAEAVA
ncbi:Hypothetical protein A7982_04304 [Minicystis rosea]|nr:Hypothetical protein A7982_04304 [Minicystis rosea]